MRRAMVVVVAAAGVGVGVAAGAASGEPSRTAVHGSSLARTASLATDPAGALRFTVHTLDVRRGKVTLHMHNSTGALSDHGIAIQGPGTLAIGRIVAPGQVANLTVRLRPGRYTFFCPVPGHRAAGMRGTLIVK